MNNNKLFVAVDKDGTEKISNSFIFPGADACNDLMLRYDISDSDKKHFEKKKIELDGVWCDDYSTGYYQVPIFSGTVVPEGTIEKIIGKKITFDDGVQKINF